MISVGKERGTSEGSLYPQFDCSLSCTPILDPLLVWDIATSAGDNDFTFPDLSRGGKDGTVGDRSLIPVARHKIHIFADRDAAIMNGERSARASKSLLHSDVSGVGEGLVDGNTGRKLHNLLVGARGMKVITFSKFPGL